MATGETCDQCGVGFSSDVRDDAVVVGTTINGERVTLNFCSSQHCVEWMTEHRFGSDA